MINGPETLLASQQRVQGYIEAFQKNRLKFDPLFIVSSNLTAQNTEEAMKHLLSLKRKPTAIVTFNDYVALDAIRYAKKANLEINKDISFVSFANLPFIHYLDSTPLASVEQYPYIQGQKATEILIDLIAANGDEEDTALNQKIIVEPKLVVFQQQ